MTHWPAPAAPLATAMEPWMTMQHVVSLLTSQAAAPKQSRTLMKHFSLVMVDPSEKIPRKSFKSLRVKPNIPVPSAASNMPPPATYRGTSKRIAVSTHNQPKSATYAIKRTSRCPHSRCTSSRTNYRTVATFVANSFRAPGSCKAIYGRTRAKNPMGARIAARHSRIAVI